MSLHRLLGGDVVEAARGLLGHELISEIGGSRTAVMLSEVEAYDGAHDPASHAHGGKTSRNSSMFGEAGTLYVYRSYGIHWCMNVTCGPSGRAAAVLLRGGRPVQGMAVMEQRRGRRDHLADGPGKLAQALGVTGDLDGIDVLGDGPLRIGDRVEAPTRIQATPRIGISRATDRLWRFVATE